MTPSSAAVAVLENERNPRQAARARTPRRAPVPRRAIRAMSPAIQLAGDIVENGNGAPFPPIAAPVFWLSEPLFRAAECYT
jgi:hypothetical protein